MIGSNLLPKKFNLRPPLWNSHILIFPKGLCKRKHLSITPSYEDQNTLNIFMNIFSPLLKLTVYNPLITHDQNSMPISFQ